MKLKPGKYLRSEDNGHFFIFDESTAKLPQMRVVQVTEDEIEVEEDITPSAPAELTRDELEAQFIEKFKRKPHPKMRLEKMRALIDGTDGHDPSDSDS